MKEEINLLPPPVQKARLQRIYLNRIGRLLHIAIGGVGLTLLVLAGSHGVTYYIETTFEEPPKATAGEDRAITAEIEWANQLITTATKWQAGQQPWTPLAADALQAAPAGIQLIEMSGDQKKNSLILRGEFNSRTAVTQYREALEVLPWVNELTAPLSNFATGSGVNFIFELERTSRLESTTSPTPAVTNTP